VFNNFFTCLIASPLTNLNKGEDYKGHSVCSTCLPAIGYVKGENKPENKAPIGLSASQKLIVYMKKG